MTICYHYKYTPDYVLNMDCDLFDLCFDHIGYMTNQQMLRDFKSNSYGNMTDKGRSEVHRKVMKLAYPDMFRRAQSVTTDQIKLV